MKKKKGDSLIGKASLRSPVWGLRLPCLLCLLLARRVLRGEAVPTVSLLPRSVPLHSDQGGGMSVSRVSVNAADAASRASCPPA